MHKNIFTLFLFSLTVQRLASYTTRTFTHGGILYEWEDWKTRTTSKALRLKIFQEQMILINVVPDVVYHVPDEICEAIFKTEKGEIAIRDNNPMQFEDIQKPPIKVTWDNCEPKTYYSLTFTDPDTPLIRLEHQLWFLGNIYNCSLDTADVIFDYKVPDINDTLGLHRFIFFIFKQPCKIDHFEEQDNPNFHRTNISAEEFSAKYNMTAEPVAGNFFVIDFTEYNLRKYPWRYYKKRPYSPTW